MFNNNKKQIYGHLLYFYLYLNFINNIMSLLKNAMLKYILCVYHIIVSNG